MLNDQEQWAFDEVRLRLLDGDSVEKAKKCFAYTQDLNDQERANVDAAIRKEFNV